MPLVKDKCIVPTRTVLEVLVVGGLNVFARLGSSRYKT